MNIKNIKIGTRMGLGMGFVFILAATLGIVSQFQTNELWKNTQKFYDHPFAVNDAVHQIQIDVMAIHRSMKDVALANNMAQINSAINKVNNLEHNVLQNFDIVFEKFLGDLKDVERAYDAFVNWAPIREEVIMLTKSGEIEASAEITKNKGADHLEKLSEEIQVMIDFAHNKADSIYIESENTKNLADKILNGFIIAILIIVLLIAIILTRSITKPLYKLAETSKEIQSGNYTAKADENRSDEIGFLAKSMNLMALSIENQLSIKENITSIVDVLIRADNFNDYSKQLISKLCDITGSELAAFFQLDESKNRFEVISSIGLSKKQLPSFDNTLWEGETGQILNKKSIIHTKNDDKNPLIYLTSFGEIKPAETVSIPVFTNNSILGFISLAKSIPYTEQDLDLFNEFQLVLNTTYTKMLADAEIHTLAKELEQKNTDLTNKAQELKSQAIELESNSNELKKQSAELQEQNIELEIQRKQVEQANRLKSEFLSNMSHELRTPLNSIMALSKVLIAKTENILGKEETEYLKVIDRNGQNLLSLINDILDLSKIEAGKLDLLISEFSPSYLLEIVEGNFKQLVSEKKLRLNIDIAGKVPNIEGDEAKTMQVLQNIVSNAVKYTESGEVNIRLHSENNNVIFEIQDTGIGIPDDFLPHVFDEFRQVDGSVSRKYEGTGLGLSIVKKLSTLLGGDITVKSKLGKGSTFTFILPKKWTGEKEVAESIFIPKYIPQKTATKTLMIIDDDIDVLRKFTTYLENEDYKIVSSTSAIEGLRLTKEIKPYAIILDLLIPDMDGFEILEKLKKDPETRDIPVIMISVTENQDAAFALGAKSYLVKPIDKIALLNELGKLEFKKLNKVLVVDDNELDRSSITTFLNEEKINVLEAKNGIECMNILEKEIPDVLILDLIMPEMDGLQVIKEIENIPSLINLPVIIVTAKTLSKLEKDFLERHSSSIILKDGSPTQNLAQRVNEALIKISKRTVFKSSDKQRILIIEDNPETIVQVRYLLEETGYIVDSVTSGGDAYKYLENTIPDGIILDLMMPEIDGFEVLENIRKREELFEIPVLILSAKDITEEELKRLTSNHVKFLVQKGSINKKGLLERINSMINPLDETIPETSVVIEKVVEKEAKKTKQGEIKKILIIEDNADNLITIKAIIGDKYEITEAITGKEGLHKAFHEKPDLILLDISLPEVDGLTISKTLKADMLMQNIPIIAVTARAMKDDREEILSAGCDDYISKPIDPDLLIQSIEKWNKTKNNG